MTLDEQFKLAMRSANDFRAANRALFAAIDDSFRAVASMRLQDIVPRFENEFQRLASLQAEIARTQSVFESPLFDLSQIASLSASQGFSQQLKDFSTLTPRMSELLKAEGRTFGSFVSVMSQLSFQSHIAKVSEITLLSQRSLAEFSFKQIAQGFQVADAIRDSFKQAHLSLAQEYSGLFRSFELDKAKGVSFAPVLSYLPSVEFYTGTRVIRSVTVPEDAVSEEEQIVLGDITAENRNIVETSLTRINPHLIQLWRGAGDALESTNSDAARHFITSLRELLTQVIHELSPDDQVRAWSREPEYFHDGRPTRRARLFYICREIDHEPFNRFLEKDIESVLSCFDMFQAGTHQVETPFSVPQLRALKLRVESAIRFLLDLLNKPDGA